MSFRLMVVIFFVGMLVSGCNVQKDGQITEQPAEKAQKIEVSPVAWVYSLDEGLKQAQGSQKPLMVDFFTDWCGWCQKLDRDVYTNPEIVKLSASFVCVKVDGEKYRADAQKYGVNGFPTIVFMKANGEVIEKIVGYNDAEEFNKIMSKILMK